MTLAVLPILGLPEITPGADLAALIAGSAELRDGDVVVVAQKAISKAEGALVRVDPAEGRHAARRRLAREQAVRVVAETPWVLITETVHGLVCANGGIDASNVPDGALALLPADPDASARRLRAALAEALGVTVAVVVADTFGRPWRHGQTDVTIGVAGLRPIRDERGGADREGVPLEVTEVAVADELAAAADLVRRKAAGVPVVIVRGFDYEPDDMADGRPLLRPPAWDLFRRGRGMLAADLAGGGQRPQPGDVPVASEDLALVRQVAGRWEAKVQEIEGDGAPTVLRIDGDRLAAGLVAAALGDLGYRVAVAPADPPRVLAGLPPELALREPR